MATEAPDFNSMDLIELSDLAWTAVDPHNLHEDEERLWVAALPLDWPPPRSVDALRAALASMLGALRDAADPQRLELVAAVMCLLAAHPAERTLDEALVTKALQEEFATAPLPPELVRELAARTVQLDPALRTHAARHPEARNRRHPPPDLAYEP